MKPLPLLIALATLLASALRAETHYELSEIIPPDGGSLLVDNTSYPATLFASGRVFGYYKVGQNYHAFVWKAGIFIDLGLAPTGFDREVKEIGSTGEFIGKISDSNGIHLMVWRNAPYTAINPPTGTTIQSALLTNTGRIAGAWLDATSQQQVYLWFNGDFTAVSAPMGASALQVKTVNSLGRAVGLFKNATNSTRLFTAANGVFTDLIPEDAIYNNNYAPVMADSGLIAGSYQHVVDNVYRSALFTWSNGVFFTSDVPGSNLAIYLTGVTESGKIIGYIYGNADIQSRSFTWFNGVFTELVPSTLYGSGAIAINESGRIIGYINTTTSNNNRAFTWFNGVLTDLTPSESSASSATAINASGDILGHSYDSRGYPFVFIWSDGILTNVTPSGARDSEDISINSGGRAIGYYRGPGAAYLHAFTAYQDTFTDLHPLSVANGVQSYATQLNDSNQILVTTASFPECGWPI